MVNTLPSGDGKESSVLVSQPLALEEARNNLLQQEQEFAMLEEQVQLVSERLLVTSDVEKQLRKLERDYDVKQSLYKDMLSRYEMAKVTGKLVKYEGPDKVKTIERAYSPTQPINTSMLMTVIVGIVLGIFTGSASVFVAALCDSHLKDIKTIEKLTSAEVVQYFLSSMPKLTSVILKEINHECHALSSTPTSRWPRKMAITLLKNSQFSSSSIIVSLEGDRQSAFEQWPELEQYSHRVFV